MTMEFHRKRYLSERGPEDVALGVKVPASMRAELFALSIAQEEPMCSIVLRLAEDYVDARQGDVARGMMRVAPQCRPECWDEGRIA